MEDQFALSESLQKQNAVRNLKLNRACFKNLNLNFKLLAH